MIGAAHHRAASDVGEPETPSMLAQLLESFGAEDFNNRSMLHGRLEILTEGQNITPDPAQIIQRR